MNATTNSMGPDKSSANATLATVAAHEAGLTPRALLFAARKRFGLFFAAFVAIVVLTVFWTLGQSRMYRSEALLRLDPTPPKPLGQRVELVSDSSGSYWNRREFYESEYRIMRSMRVATAVVRSLGLNADPGFLGAKHPKSGPFKPWSVEAAAALLVSRVSVEPVRESSLANIRYEDTDPKRAQLVLVTLVRSYLALNLEQATDTSTTALEWLNGQLDHLRTDLESSEVALNDFRKKNNVLSISLEDTHNLIASQLGEVTKEITSAEAREYELSSKHEQLMKVELSQPESAGASELLSSLVLGGMRSSYAEQSRSLAELTATLGDDHPKVAAAKAKLDVTAKSIRSEIQNIQRASQRDLKAVESQLGKLRAKESSIQKQAHELQGFEVFYNQLNRTKTNNEKLYSLVLERTRETDMTRMMNFNNIRVIDAPNEPVAPFRPNVPVNLGLGLVLGVLGGLGLAIVREMSDRSVKTPSDVEVYLGVSCVGLLPEIDEGPRRGRRSGTRVRVGARELLDRDLIVAQRPDGGAAEAARAIRTNLAFMSPDRPYRSVAVTSAVPQEGKTTVAVSLATVLAQSGLRVVLVDTDLRRPRLHRTFRLSNDVGVSMAVSGQTPLDECVRETAVENLYVLTSGPIPPNPAEILHSDKFRQLARDLEGRFDRIIFDTPPILPVTDAAIISKLVDGMLVVARGFSTPRTACAQAIRALQSVNGHIIGVILNAIDFGRHDYNEYHYYYKREPYYTAEPTDRPRASGGAATGVSETHQ